MRPLKSRNAFALRRAAAAAAMEVDILLTHRADGSPAPRTFFAQRRIQALIGFLWEIRKA
jgi:hypothetical protein